MKKLQWAMILATAGMLATGCETMKQFNEAMKKQADEQNAKRAEDERRALAEQHLAENKGETVPGADLEKAALGAEKFLVSRGFTVDSKRQQVGFGGDRYWVAARKIKDTALGSS